MLLAKDGKDQLDRLCEKWRSITIKEQKNILHEISKWKANWIGHIWHRNCLLQWVIEGKIKGGIEVTGRWGRRRRKLLDDHKERRGYSHLKEEAVGHTMWRACFGKGFRPVIRQTTKRMSLRAHYRHFRRTCFLHFQGTLLLPWKWMQQDPMSVGCLSPRQRSTTDVTYFV